MDLSNILSRWKATPSIFENVSTWHFIPAKNAQWESFPKNLDSDLVYALSSLGIKQLYSHQLQCWECIKAGGNAVITSGTASGKSLCYNLPILNEMLKDEESRALYLFPTKALAQDQYQNILEIIRYLDNRGKRIVSATYDGDTPPASRPEIRTKARILITNPDMLHIGILPHHTNWAEFFKNLRFVVIDEAHIYRGIFGSHVTNVIRRLNRIANYYGSFPQFISTTATIANPIEHIEKLTEHSFNLINIDGSQRGEKHFLIYNPPIIDQELGIRRSALQEAIPLGEDLLTYDIQTIVFARSRRTVEMVLTYLREKIKASPIKSWQDQNEIIRGYRSGYLPRQRRAIEKDLREGKTRIVIATNALELGIDIGDIKAALLIGYPGTIASTRQQAGRAGRGSAASLAVLICTANPLDQFLARHPEFILDKSPESALIDPNNLLILLGHIRCAAFELPFRHDESFGNLGSELTGEYLSLLADDKQLFLSKDRYFWMAEQYPAQGISLRTASPENISLEIDQESRLLKIGEVDFQSAFWLVHPKAVYIHEGQQFIVEELDLDQHKARLSRKDTDYYTLPIQEVSVQLINKLGEVTIQPQNESLACAAYGEVIVTNQVKGYRKLGWYTNEPMGVEELDLPPSTLQTTAFWLSLSETIIERLRQKGMWLNDPNDYGPQWDALREIVRKRDNYRCQHCGAMEKGRAHDVHHKIPLRAFDSLEQANQLENLITLCHNCHNLAESALRIRSGLAGLAHVLGHLAPIYLMCDPSDLGIHSDPRASIADNQPAVIIYDNVPAGIGFSERLFLLIDELLLAAFDLITSCPCQDGCPSCVGPGSENGAGGKRETLSIIELLIAKQYY